MTDPKQPISQGMIQMCSRLLLIAGAVVFLVGDGFLYEIKHVNFVLSAAIGILGGVLFMLLGAGILVASRSLWLGRHFD